MSPSVRTTLLRISLCALIIPSGCTFTSSSRNAGEASGGRMITAEMIADAGLTTGWDVLRRFGDHISFGEHGTNGPTQATRRGRQSVYLREDPLLVIDGARMSDFRSLTTVPAHTISTMEILTALEASTQFGMRAASGAIVVRTAQR